MIDNSLVPLEPIEHAILVVRGHRCSWTKISPGFAT